MAKKMTADEALAHAIRRASDDLSIAISEAWKAGLTVDVPREDWWSVEWEDRKRLLVAHNIKVHRGF